MPLAVHIKHAGTLYDVPLDTDRPPAVFKDAIYHLTGVPTDRMKVMIKGGILKDETDWKKVAPKEGQTFMVIGAPGELPKPPEKPIVFIEDMNDEELAQSAIELPVGLKNLGNTCYMNATVQAFRAIPELQTALDAPQPQLPPLPSALRVLYAAARRTTEPLVPLPLVTTLRAAAPQFSERDRGGKGIGYAQQDAEECWGALTHALKDVQGLPPPPPSSADNEDQEMAEGGASAPEGGPAVTGAAPTPAEPSTSVQGAPQKKFIEQYMAGELQRTLTCAEAPEEAPSISREQVLKLECNISINTNFMHSGIMESLTQSVIKSSPTLGRDAEYTAHARLARMPGYLTVHMVRFAWRRDIGRKAKIMRKVKFPTEYDAIDLATDELRERMLPLARRLTEIEKDRHDRAAVRRRNAAAGIEERRRLGSTTAAASPPAPEVQGGGETDMVVDPSLAPEPEAEARRRERRELEKLVDPALRADVGCSVHGQYELVAIVTHKGAAADAGHYMGFVKKSVFHDRRVPGQHARDAATLDENDEDWYKFDDEKVTVFPKEKLATLDGGGEDSSAYVLLYKSKPLA